MINLPHLLIKRKDSNYINAAERYRIDFLGKCEKDFDPEKVIADMAALFRAEKDKIAAMFDGNPRMIKKNLEWEQALRYRTMLNKIGAPCDIRVMMDLRSLKEALEPVNPLPNKNAAPFVKPEVSVPQKNTMIRLYFDRIRIVPKIFSLPFNEPLFNVKGKDIGSISSLTCTLSLFSAYCISIVIGYFLQWFVSDLYAKHISTGFSASILSIVVFFSCVVLLPNRIRPSRKMELTYRSGKKVSKCRYAHLNTGLSFQRTFRLQDDQDHLIAECCHDTKTQRYFCRNSEDYLIVYADEGHISPDDIAAESGLVIGEHLIDHKAVKKISNVINRIDKQGTAGGKITKRQVKKKMILYSKDGKEIGHVLMGRRCILTFYPNDKHSHDLRLLIMLGTIIAGL